MIMPSYQTSDAAEEDLQEIMEYTLTRHGEKQAFQYIDDLEECTENLARSYGHYKEIHGLHPGMRVKHCQHHYIFGIMREHAPMLVIAIFHERMDLLVRLKDRLT